MNEEDAGEYLKAALDDKSYQLFLAGQVLGAMSVSDTPERLKKLTKQIDPDVLQKFLDSKPEGFLYSDAVAKVIRIVRTLKSFSREIKPSPLPGQDQ